MSQPTLYYIRHGETEWNAQGRLQGRHDSALASTGRAHAVRCGDILQDLFAREGRNAADLDYVSSPLGRARTTMELLRGVVGLAPDAYRTDARLAEMSFGEWEGLTFSEVKARAPDVLAARERDMWGFFPPGGESYAHVAARIGEWSATIARDTVVTAHGGTARALFAHLGIVGTDEAVATPITQGAVYVISGARMSCYA